MRYEHSGNARKAVLSGTIADNDLTIACDDLTGWPDGSTAPFWGVIDRNTPSEEKVLFVSRSANTLTVWSSGGDNGRGKDSTTAQSHQASAVIEHVFTAVEADAANAHVEATSNVHGVTGDLVGRTSTQTLTNKTMSGASNTFSAIPQSAVTGLETALTGKANLSGATFTGEVDVVSATAAGSTSVRQITISTSDPSGGADGDIWVKYV